MNSPCSVAPNPSPYPFPPALPIHLHSPLPCLPPTCCSYSEEFESTFMEHLKRAHPYSRIAANVVYNEYIQDRWGGAGRRRWQRAEHVPLLTVYSEAGVAHAWMPQSFGRSYLHTPATGTSCWPPPCPTGAKACANSCLPLFPAGTTCT